MARVRKRTKNGTNTETRRTNWAENKNNEYVYCFTSHTLRNGISNLSRQLDTSRWRSRKLEWQVEVGHQLSSISPQSSPKTAERHWISYLWTNLWSHEIFCVLSYSYLQHYVHHSSASLQTLPPFQLVLRSAAKWSNWIRGRYPRPTPHHQSHLQNIFVMISTCCKLRSNYRGS